jgi:hypothetical protein
MRSGHSTTQTVRYWRMLRVSDTADDENRKTCRPIPVAGPMRHVGEVLSAQFSADGQRVVTASRNKTARVWDAPDDVLLLADLADAACGSVLQTSGQTEILRSFIASNLVFWCLEVPLTAKPSAPINARLPIGRWEGSERSRNVRCVFRPKSRRLSGPRPPRLECNSCRHPRSRVYPLA